MKPQSFSPAPNCLCPLIIISDISEVIVGGLNQSLSPELLLSKVSARTSGMDYRPQEWLPCYVLLQLLVQGKVAGKVMGEQSMLRTLIYPEHLDAQGY